jgi:hypothetical protein
MGDVRHDLLERDRGGPATTAEEIPAGRHTLLVLAQDGLHTPTKLVPLYGSTRATTDGKRHTGV